jgi:D-alanine transaminase
LARERFEVKEEKFSLDDLYQADEVFVTSTTKEVLGVVEIDEREIANGQIGSVTEKLHQAYQDYVEEFKNSPNGN